jgi:peptide/nickel transport system substrate-binding protein
MRRRGFVLGSAGLLAAPALAQPAGDVLRYVAGAEVAAIDPVWRPTPEVRDAALLIYDTLYGLDDALRPQPQMVEGHTVSDDGLTWRMKLRERLVFHDGTRVLARDCAASIKRWGSRDAVGMALMEAAEEVTAGDDRTIVVRLRYPFPLLPVLLARSAPSPCVIMPERLARTDPSTAVTDATGSGPYRLVPESRLAFERFDGYVPRGDGASQGTAGPKIAYFRRVEWSTTPDAAGALMRGEVDWLRQPAGDQLALLRKAPGITTEVLETLGTMAVLRFNDLAAPFNNPAIRRALLPALSQADYMTAVCGDDREAWRDGVGFLAPGTEYDSPGGMDALRAPRDLAAAQRALVAAGYNGERVAILSAADDPTNRKLAAVSAELLGKIGFAVDLQSMDTATFLRRQTMSDPVAAGGWSIFHTQLNGADTVNPALHAWMRGNGRGAPPGWPVSAAFEAMRGRFLRETDPGEQKLRARQMQAQAFEDLPYVPLGQIFTRSAYRTNLKGVLKGLPVFWNVRRG